MILIPKDNVTVLPSWRNYCKSSPRSFDESRTTPSQSTATNPQTKPTDCGCKSNYRPLLSIYAIAIHYWSYIILHYFIYLL